MITATLLSGVVAVAVAAAEWVGSDGPLGSPAGIVWSLVAVLGVAATVLGVGLELRRRRQAERARPAVEAAGRPDRPGLPTGTVTFLFTDIEGSTRLLQDPGDRYGTVRDEHAAILRRAIRDGGGVEVSTEGDSFFAAAAAGGQVLVTDATRMLVERQAPAGVTLRDLGVHRLRS